MRLTVLGLNSDDLQDAAKTQAMLEALRASQSLDSRQRILSEALWEKLKEQGKYPWIRDVFDKDFVYEVGQELFQRSYTIDEAKKVTMGDPIEVEVVYQPRKVEESAASEVELDFVPLTESALNPRDNTVGIKVIAPGQGSSGYYPKDMLKRDGPQVFKKGLQMFWDHQTAQEEADRPEGSLRNLAAVLMEDAKWQDAGPAGPGLYSRAEVLPEYRETIDQIGKHIGVSIRAFGKAKQGQVAGKPTRIIEQLTGAKSVDFVTVPGAGGQVLQLFEAARGRQIPKEEKIDMTTEERLARLEADLKSVQEANTRLTAENDRLKEAAVINRAHQVVSARLQESDAQGLSERARKRVARLTIGEPANVDRFVKDGKLDEAKLAEAVKAAVDDEVADLQESTGKVRGMGSAGAPPAQPNVLKEADTKLKSSMDRLLPKKQ